VDVGEDVREDGPRPDAEDDAEHGLEVAAGAVDGFGEGEAIGVVRNADRAGLEVGA
jgi:hypothetical protein